MEKNVPEELRLFSQSTHFPGSENVKMVMFFSAPWEKIGFETCEYFKINFDAFEHKV